LAVGTLKTMFARRLLRGKGNVKVNNANNSNNLFTIIFLQQTLNFH